MRNTAVSPLWFLAAAMLVGLAVAGRRLALRGATRDRLFDRDEPAGPSGPEPTVEPRGWLGEWLALANYREPGAARRFVGATVGLLLLGGAVGGLLWWSGLITRGVIILEGLPGAIGRIFVPALYLGPWTVATLLGALPWLNVRRARRRIVREVEEDLPLVLEILATLGEAGLGFDAAVMRIVEAQPPERPLTSELRAFQRELISGRPRVAALRGLARRLDVPALTIFISAIVMADQVGSGVADVLRRQADDARDRRRDRALTAAQTLPVKLLFPLVICFLPAILVVTLGPILLEFLRFADAVMNKRTPR